MLFGHVCVRFCDSLCLEVWGGGVVNAYLGSRTEAGDRGTDWGAIVIGIASPKRYVQSVMPSCYECEDNCTWVFADVINP